MVKEMHSMTITCKSMIEITSYFARIDFPHLEEKNQTENPYETF